MVWCLRRAQTEQKVRKANKGREKGNVEHKDKTMGPQLKKVHILVSKEQAIILLARVEVPIFTLRL